MKKLKIIIILFLLIHSEVINAEGYEFGTGWQVAESPITVGGYISTVVESNKHSRFATIDDAALLLYGEYDRFNFMAEFEVNDLYQKELIHDHHERTDTSFHTERLYGDYFYGNNERVRLGKFNSDIGFWNQVPINVLRDTTSSPRLVNDFFPKLTTGIQYESSQSNSFTNRISLTLQTTHGLDIVYNNMDIDRHYGFTCDVGDQRALLRFGGGYFRYEPVREAFYITTSFKLTQKEWDLLIESALRHEEKEEDFFYDVYAQGVWHFQPKNDFILRTEIEKVPLSGVRDNSVTVGYTYRPYHNVALKGEFEGHHDSMLNRVLFSLSVLF